MIGINLLPLFIALWLGSLALIGCGVAIYRGCLYPARRPFR